MPPLRVDRRIFTVSNRRWRPAVTRWTIPLWIGALAGTLAACGTTSAASRPAARLTIPPSSSPAPPLPLDSYSTNSAQDNAVILRANSLLTARCMERLGFHYPAALKNAAPGNVATARSIDVYGLTSLTQAQKYGYSTPPSSSKSTGKIPTLSQFIAEYGLPFVVALFGFNPAKPQGGHHPPGCASAGSTTIFKAAYGSANSNLVGILSGDAEAETEQARPVASVVTKWSSCMANQGFDYSTPAAPETRTWPVLPSKAEIATAVADVRCKLATNLPNTWRAFEAYYQARLINQNAVALQALQVDRAKMIQIAYRVLGEKAPVRH